MMRSLKQLTVCLAAILSICSVCSVQTSQVLAISETELTDDVARASGVFYSCNATISLGQISCLVALTDTGTVTIRTILQNKILMVTGMTIILVIRDKLIEGRYLLNILIIVACRLAEPIGAVMWQLEQSME